MNPSVVYGAPQWSGAGRMLQVGWALQNRSSLLGLWGWVKEGLETLGWR
jgi:hypothetical protein